MAHDNMPADERKKEVSERKPSEIVRQTNRERVKPRVKNNDVSCKVASCREQKKCVAQFDEFVSIELNSHKH